MAARGEKVLCASFEKIEKLWLNDSGPFLLGNPQPSLVDLVFVCEIMQLEVNCIVFDKTGTLTIGKPVVVNTKLMKTMVLGEFYELVAAAEVNSEHPLGKAIVEYAKKFREDVKKPVWLEAQNFESISGHGVKAIIRNKEILVGNKSLMIKENIATSLDAKEALSQAENMAQTGVLVAIENELVGVISISDPLKAGAREVVSILKSMKIRCIMVTGDNWGTANSVAKEVGIDDVIAEAKRIIV